MNAKTLIWLLLIAGLLGAHGLRGQSSAATLVGTVTDEGGEPVGGAQIVVSHQLNGSEAGVLSRPRWHLFGRRSTGRGSV